MEKKVTFSTWNEMLKAIPGYEKLGYDCEVMGWDDMRYNRLTIRDKLIMEAANEKE